MSELLPDYLQNRIEAVLLSDLKPVTPVGAGSLCRFMFACIRCLLVGVAVAVLGWLAGARSTSQAAFFSSLLTLSTILRLIRCVRKWCREADIASPLNCW
ncbi:MAG: hypothetical protein WKF37_00700 [Bryobacteraceae bacterium]